MASALRQDAFDEGRQPPDDETKRRIAENEVLFRAVNERIERAGERLGLEESTLPFICECGRPTCVVVIRATVRQYEDVRAGSRRFMCATGHELTAGGIARVVQEERGYVVVEKLGSAGDIAEANDPRRPG